MRLEIAVDLCNQYQECPERWAEKGVPEAELAIDPPSLGLQP